MFNSRIFNTFYLKIIIYVQQTNDSAKLENYLYFTRLMKIDVLRLHQSQISNLKSSVLISVINFITLLYKL